MKNILVSVLGCLFFCQAEFPIQLLQNNFQYELYEAGKRIEQRPFVMTEDIIQLFEKEKADWKKDNVTYAPHYVLVSQNIKINIFTHKIIVNYQTKEGKFAQYTKEIDTKELLLMINCSK